LGTSLRDVQLMFEAGLVLKAFSASIRNGPVNFEFDGSMSDKSPSHSSTIRRRSVFHENGVMGNVKLEVAANPTFEERPTCQSHFCLRASHYAEPR